MEKINRDPEVIRYLNRPVDDAAVARFHAGCIDHWQEHGFGFFAVESREEATLGRFIGFVGVAYASYLAPLATRPELGWRLERRSWGRGLATEAALAVREDAFGRHGLEELISIIHPDNAGFETSRHQGRDAYRRRGPQSGPPSQRGRLAARRVLVGCARSGVRMSSGIQVRTSGILRPMAAPNIGVTCTPWQLSDPSHKGGHFRGFSHC